MKMIRTNEISVESVHRQGSQLQRQKDSHNAATLSFRLREFEALTFFTPLELAGAVAEVRHDKLVAEKFSLAKHKVYVDLQDELTLANKTMRSGKDGSFKMIRQIFYRTDPYSMFQTFELVEKAYEQKKKSWKQDDEEREADPIKALKSASSAEEKLHGVLCRYGLKHLKQVCDEDHVYSFPRASIPELRTLSQAVCPKPRRKQAPLCTKTCTCAIHIYIYIYIHRRIYIYTHM